TKSLAAYFGDTVYEFGIEKAIGKYLTPYNYHPLLVHLSATEFDEYVRLSAQISRLYAIGSQKTEADRNLKSLQMKRARILGDADEKYLLLESLLRNASKSEKRLIYCSDYSEDSTSPIDK